MTRRSIDFLLLGVPRSGTTALVDVLNLSPDVFCGMECLIGREGHRSFRYPDSMLGGRSLTTRERRLLMREVARKPSPAVVGNKYPRYYLDLDALLGLLPDTKLVWLYRSPEQFCSSWNQRAADADDTCWSRGQTGVFGAMELLICLDALLKADRATLVVPYQAMFFENAKAVFPLFDFLGVKSSRRIARWHRKRFFSQAPAQSKQPSVSDEEASFLRSMRLDKLEQLVDRDAPFLFSDIRDDVRAYLSEVKQAAIADFLALANGFTPEQAAYFEGWRSIAGVRRFMDNEEALGDKIRRIFNMRWRAG